MQFLSLSKASMAKRHPSCDDGVKLSVYGIDPVGSDIKVELVKMLEARLDTTILGEIEMLLARNPNCMLTPQDVQFLQKKEPPSVSLKLSLPDEVLHHQMAVLSYLRQNLLIPDFLFHPKYQDSEHRFMDYTESVQGASPMAESNTFLFNKSPSYQNAGKGAGLAVIYLQLVDSMNHPKNILDCPKADMDGWKKLNVSSFTRLTQVTKVSPDDSSTCMSTTAFIRFSIWLRGDIDVPSLESKLSRCVQHSLSDFVCEFYALTAPLCAVPPELLCEAQTTGQIFSLPAKGNLTPKNTGSKHPPLTKAKSTTGSAFSFSSDHVSMREQLSSPTLSIAESLGDGTRTPLQVDVEKYLFGEKGHLLPFYTETLIAWFEFCTQLGVPAVTKLPCGLLNGCVVESIMKEIESVVSELPGVSVQPFKLTHGQYLPYSTSRRAETESDESEEPTHLDTPFSHLSAGHIMTVRNRQLWIDSVMGKQDDDGGPMLTPQPNSLPRVSKNNQKFPPVYVGVDTSPSLTSSLPHFSLDRQLLPRQQFLLLVIRNAELTLYSYNLADGKDMSFQEHITQSVKKVTRWNNARFHLLNSVAHQKMGLFQHASIQDVPRERHCTDKNLSTSTCEDTCLLVKSSRPVQEKPRHKSAVTAASSRLRQTTPTPGPISGLDKVFRGLKPTRPMHLSKTGKERDPIIRHGSQLLETHKNEMRDEERRNTLDSLYTNWLDRPSTEITEDQLNVLKQSSRLVHHVVTPLLFSPTWRNKAINLPKTVEELSRIEESKLAVIKQRSRNNSGTSVRSAKGGEGRSGARDSPTSAVIKGYEEETWHEEMRNAFVSSYIDYLRQTQQPEKADRSELTSLDELRFSTIKLLSRRPNKTVPEFHRKHSSGGSGTEQLVRRRATESLQMSMPGGIFLIELSFQEVYFVVKLYVFSSPLLSIYTQTYHSLHKKTYMSNLVDMCDRLKDNTHCHSFSYDFHLRAAHKYIKSSKVFHDSYHLVNMLHDFTLYYSDSPRFSRNAIAKDVLMLESTNNPCKRLYDHILKHENRVLLMMKKIAMKDEDDLENQEDPCEYALVYHKHIQNPPVSGKKLPEYEASIIIAHNHYPAQRHHAVKGSLHLAYFVILVNKEQLFPIKMTPVVSDSQPQVSDSQHVLEISADKLSADSSLSVSPISPSPIQERKISLQSPDTPFSPPTSLSVHQILANQCSDVKETLTDLVERASLQCRKNTLWSQMVQILRESDRRSVSDPSKSRGSTELSSFEEFEELLNYAVNEEIQLSESILSAVYSQSNIWFINLTKVLHAKYGSQYREYVRSDKQLTYAVVLVAGVEEAAILLRVDSQRRGAKLTLMLQDGRANHVLDDKVFNMALSDYVNTLLFHMWAQMAV